ncbi:MAG: GTPase [Candidatus Hermodarchaeota archaeon]
MKEKPSLLIIGNSNVGKSSITKLLLPQSRKYKGKTGKAPGSTLLIKQVIQPQLPYKIIDLPGFGYIKHSSHRRQEHIKQQIVTHIEKHHFDYFLALVVINILRIEDEITKYFIKNQTTIPLSFELIKFIREYSIPLLILINKVDKISNLDKKRIISFFMENAKLYGIYIINLDDYYINQHENKIPYLEFSALKKTNLGKLNHYINLYLSKKIKSSN